MPRQAATVAICVLLMMSGESAALAGCRDPSNPEHELDDAEVDLDETPPGPLSGAEVTEVFFSPKRRPQLFGGLDDICSDFGVIVIHIDDASDDRTPKDKMGYSIEEIEGSLPAAMPDTPVRLVDGNIHLGWEDNRRPFSAVISIRAVDLAGNVGPPTTIEVRDPGGMGCRAHDADSGCRMAQADFGLWILAVIGFGACRRRRRETSSLRRW